MSSDGWQPKRIFLCKIGTAHWKCGWNGTLLTRHFTDAALYDKHCLFVHS